MRKAPCPLAPRAVQALAKLGADLKNLRSRRRMPLTYLGERTLISRSTLYKVERGDPGISLGIYATVLVSYGMIERLECLVDARSDRAGLALEDARLPRRIRRTAAAPSTPR